MSNLLYLMAVLIVSAHHLELIYIFKYLFLAGLHAASFPHNIPAKYSMSSIYESVMHPMIATTSNRCAAVKSMLGLSYEQMQEKNNVQDVIEIDLITKNGNVKYNLTATEKIQQLMAEAQTVVILIHGFTDSSDGMMVNAIGPRLLKKPDLKTFALDGRKIINMEYFSSSTNVRFMGELLGSFLADIVEGGQDPSKFHIAGHSLGSQIAGAAGKKFHDLTGKRIGRITGLDPAGPCFTNVGPDERLDETDAEYVDVIHTDQGSFGLKEPVGHKDFYPNGGSSQPGCFIIACDHCRAVDLFAESVASPKSFPARKCEDWSSYGEGLCSENEISYMGFESASSSPGFYFLTTNDRTPFGLGSAGCR